MKQSRLHSALESFTNIFVGWGVALAAQLVIFPLYDIQVSFITNLWISVWFTGVSFIRSYLLRRLFTNWRAGDAR